MAKNVSVTKSTHRIPMHLISQQHARDFGIALKDVRYIVRAGRKFLYTYIETEITDEGARVLKNLFNQDFQEFRKKDRRSRCEIPDGRGKTKLCPETCHCGTDECPLKLPEKPEHTVDVLLESEMESNHDFASKDNVEKEAEVDWTLQKLIEHLRKVDPVYGDIFRMLYDEKTQQEIADAIGKNRRTVSDDIKKVRKLAQQSGLYEK